MLVLAALLRSSSPPAPAAAPPAAREPPYDPFRASPYLPFSLQPAGAPWASAGAYAQQPSLANGTLAFVSGGDVRLARSP